jgi:acetyl esterase/lipase
MSFSFRLGGWSLLLGFFLSTAAVSDPPRRLVVIGDSLAASQSVTRYPHVGYGLTLSSYFRDDRLEVHNLAIPGRSTKTYHSDPAGWPRAQATLRAGDILLINFGHNDAYAADPERYTEPHAAYQDYLRTYVAAAREAGADPVLVTPVAMNRWAAGNPRDELSAYAQSMRDLAAELDVPLIDLYARTQEQLAARGADYAAANWYLQLEPGAFAQYPDGKTDPIHLRLGGALLVDRLLIREIHNWPDSPLRARLLGALMPTTGQLDFPADRHTVARLRYPLLLYPAEMPNHYPGSDSLEFTDYHDDGHYFVRSTTQPTLEVFPADQPNGQAVLICPGGGYAGTSMVKEGYEVAQALTAAGVTAFVLKYRIPDSRSQPAPHLAPLQDAQAALRTIRRRAADWGIDPRRIGIMGFSAGGHLAATAATLFSTPADPTVRDTTSVRPDFVALIYPVISFTEDFQHRGSRINLLGNEAPRDRLEQFSPERQVGSDAPPAFLVHAADDTAVPIANSIAYYEACLAHRIPAEMHLYPGGGHGFGLRNPTTSDAWIDRCINWLATLPK